MGLKGINCGRRRTAKFITAWMTVISRRTVVDFTLCNLELTNRSMSVCDNLDAGIFPMAGRMTVLRLILRR
jgi:hypothetical protein